MPVRRPGAAAAAGGGVRGPRNKEELRRGPPDLLSGRRLDRLARRRAAVRRPDHRRHLAGRAGQAPAREGDRRRAMTDAAPAPAAVPLRVVAAQWGRIGITGFGGPPAHLALFRRLCVEERRWISSTEYEDAIASANLLSGPASTQVAIFCRWRVRGMAGGLVGGAAFILPELVVVLALAVLLLGEHPPVVVLGRRCRIRSGRSRGRRAGGVAARGFKLNAHRRRHGAAGTVGRVLGSWRRVRRPARPVPRPRAARLRSSWRSSSGGHGSPRHRLPPWWSPRSRPWPPSEGCWRSRGRRSRWALCRTAAASSASRSRRPTPFPCTTG